MNKEQLAAILEGGTYGKEITKDDCKLAKDAGLVVVFGYSDDNIEFRGAITDELGLYDGGRTFHFMDGALVLDPSQGRCEHCERRTEARYLDCAKLTARWCAQGSDWTWTFETELPHAVFHITDGEEKFCRGVVLDVRDMPGVWEF